MSMCYLCAMCKHRTEVRGWDRSVISTCDKAQRREFVAIDWGKQDPREVCVDYEPREGSE